MAAPERGTIAVVAEKPSVARNQDAVFLPDALVLVCSGSLKRTGLVSRHVVHPVADTQLRADYGLSGTMTRLIPLNAFP
jgi:hypothetical protein